MRLGFLAAAICAAAAPFWLNGASAATFSYDFTVSAHTSQSGGTAVSASNFTSPDFTLNSVNAETGYHALFKLTINEPIDKTDEISNAITVNFTFSAPGAENASIAGTTTGKSSGKTLLWIPVGGKLTVDWPDTPAQITFDDGTVLAAHLMDTVIEGDPNEVCTGISGWILVNFKLLALPPELPPPGNPPAETPVPGALPLFVSGLAIIGIVMRRRRGKRTA
jgi:hypothetical protein